MDSKRLIVSMVFITILVVFFVWIIGVAISDLGRRDRIWKEKAKHVTDAVEYVNSRNLDIMYYGEELKGPEALKIRKIDSLQDKDLVGPEDLPEYDGRVLIINDPNGTLPLEKEDWSKIQTLLRHEEYTVIYFGSEQLPVMQEMGFFFDVYPKTTRSIIFWDDGKKYEVGFADNPLLIPEVVREQLTPERKAIFTAIMKIASEKYF